jgi:hypothetical protein
MSSVDELLQEAKQLPEDQRLTLVHRILAAGESSVSQDVEQAWDLVIRKRILQYDQGKAAFRPAGDVFAEVDRRIGS